MQPRYMAAFLLLCCSLEIFAAELHLGKVALETEPATVEVPISLLLGAGEKVSGIQFELVFDPSAVSCAGILAGASASTPA